MLRQKVIFRKDLKLQNIRSLTECFELLKSTDYKQRLQGDFDYTYLRYRAIRRTIEEYSWSNESEFKTPEYVFRMDLAILKAYMCILYQRAKFEGIELKVDSSIKDDFEFLNKKTYAFDTKVDQYHRPPYVVVNNMV